MVNNECDKNHLKLFRTHSEISLLDINLSLLMSILPNRISSLCLASWADSLENSSFASREPTGTAELQG